MIQCCLFVPLHPFSTSCHDNPKTRASQYAQRGVTFLRRGEASRVQGLQAADLEGRPWFLLSSAFAQVVGMPHAFPSSVTSLRLTSATPPLGSRMRDPESVVTRSRVDWTLQTTNVQVCPVNDKKLERYPQRFGMVPLTNMLSEVSLMGERPFP